MHKAVSTLIGIEHIGKIQKCGLALEVAPSQFGSWYSDAQCTTLENLGKIASFQSLFFGTDLNFFKNANAWSEHLIKVVKMAEQLNVPYLVLGGPKSRFKADDQCQSDLIGCLVDICSNTTVVIGLEANPTQYGANTFVTGKDTALHIRSAQIPNLKYHLDVGCALLAQEDPKDLLMNNQDIIDAVHISWEKLTPGAYSKQYLQFIKTAKHLNKSITLEILNGAATDIDLFRSVVQL